MGKIPVGRTIAQTYGFAFGKYFTLLQITWLPLLASAALSFYFRGPLMAEMMASAHGGGGFASMARFQPTSLLLQLVGLLLFAIMSVGITKEVLGLRTGLRFFYAGFGAAELRVIVGYFAIVLLFIVFIIAMIVGAVVVGLLSRAVLSHFDAAVAKPLVGLGFALLVLFIYLWLIYAMVRLTFLFLPATVAEHRIGIARSWELTRGNFWRIVAIGIVVLLPIFVIAVCAVFAILGPGYIPFVIEHSRDPAAIQEYVVQHMMVLMQNFPLLLVAGIIINPILYGLMIGPAAFAYRALVPAPVEDQAMPEPEPKKQDSGLPDVIEEVVSPLAEEAGHGGDHHDHGHH